MFFWFFSDEKMSKKIVIKIKPEENAKIGLNFFPINKGKSSCDIQITIADNPFEAYRVNHKYYFNLAMGLVKLALIEVLHLRFKLLDFS